MTHCEICMQSCCGNCSECDFIRIGDNERDFSLCPCDCETCSTQSDYDDDY